MLTVNEALDSLLEMARQVPESETVVLKDANGRVLTESQYSTIDVPNADNAAMDGYAIRFSDLNGTGTVLIVRQRVPAGQTGGKLKSGEAARIFTGAPIPEGADTVVRQEWCEADGDQLRFTRLPEKKGESVRYRGEDLEKGDLVLKKGTRLQAQHLGIAASVGLMELPITRRLKVALMSTGDELVKQGESLTPGKIYNSNRYTLRALLENLGCAVTDLGIIADNLKATQAAFVQAVMMGHDLILTSGGVSVGEEDHVKPAIESLGRLHFWRVAVKPGKPLVFGEIDELSAQPSVHSTPIIGLPGNPVSSFVTFLLFVRPFLLRMQGVEDVFPASFSIRADFGLDNPDERNEFLRVRLNEAGGLELFVNQGSGVMSSTVWGDGLIDNPPGQSVAKGDSVRFIPFSELLN